MNIKPILLISTIFCFLILLPNAYGQNKVNKWPPDKFPHNPKNCFHLLSNSYQCNWIFYGIKGTLEGTVIAYNTMPSAATGPGTACVSIIKTATDTIRVLTQKATDHKKGDHIRFTQAREPELDLLVPFDRDFSIAEEKKGNNPQCRINEYDGRIYKTTWGNIVDQTAPTPKKAVPVKKPAPKRA